MLVPTLAITGYLLYPKNLRINTKLLYYLSIIHNTFLIIFSLWTFISLVYILIVYGVVCRSNYYFQIKYFDRVIYLFYLSKYYEFFDTFLIYLNGKSPIFLQKYHHIGAVICWHLTYIYKVDCIILSSIVNSFVHSLMYSYYLGCLLKIRQVKLIKKYITILQLTQLTAPIFISLYVYRPPIETNINYSLIIMSNVYVSILIYLFIKFYNKNYKFSPSENVATFLHRRNLYN